MTREDAREQHGTVLFDVETGMTLEGHFSILSRSPTVEALAEIHANDEPLPPTR